jgi:iron complex outermembrane receptor protein
MPMSQDLSDDQTNSIGFRSTLNYKDTLWSVPFETSLGTEMALMHILFFSKFICFATQSREYCRSPIQQQQKSSYQNYFSS